MRNAGLLIALVALVSIFGFAADAQATDGAMALANNEYLQKATELKEKANAALASGNYDAAALYAQQAAEYLKQSDEFVDLAVRVTILNNGIKSLDVRLADVMKTKSDANFPMEFATARDATAQAKASMQKKDYDNAENEIQKANLALANLPSGVPLPQYYKVRLLLPNRDCLWRIAALPAVYNDSYQWEKLYQANRDKLKYPNNPHLIYPDQVLIIPSINGERRAGEFNPAKVYPELLGQETVSK